MKTIQKKVKEKNKLPYFVMIFLALFYDLRLEGILFLISLLITYFFKYYF